MNVIMIGLRYFFERHWSDCLCLWLCTALQLCGVGITSSISDLLWVGSASSTGAGTSPNTRQLWTWLERSFELMPLDNDDDDVTTNQLSSTDIAQTTDTGHCPRSDTVQSLIVLCDTHDTSILIVDTYLTIPVSPMSRYIAIYSSSKKYRETAQISRVSTTSALHTARTTR